MMFGKRDMEPFFMPRRDTLPPMKRYSQPRQFVYLLARVRDAGE